MVNAFVCRTILVRPYLGEQISVKYGFLVRLPEFRLKWGILASKTIISYWLRWLVLLAITYGHQCEHQIHQHLILSTQILHVLIILLTFPHFQHVDIELLDGHDIYLLGGQRLLVVPRFEQFLVHVTPWHILFVHRPPLLTVESLSYAVQRLTVR